jgi:hypothetical protein
MLRDKPYKLIEKDCVESKSTVDHREITVQFKDDTEHLWLFSSL